MTAETCAGQAEISYPAPDDVVRLTPQGRLYYRGKEVEINDEEERGVLVELYNEIVANAA